MHPKCYEKGTEASRSKRMHADLEKYITHPSPADRQEGTQREVNRHRRNILQVTEHVPGPPVKKHCNHKAHDAVLHVVQGKGADKLEAPGQEDHYSRI